MYISQALTWEAVAPKIEEFREVHIQSSIANTEAKEKPMLEWLATLPMHKYDVPDEQPENEDLETMVS